jgi:hypothetical protein
MHSFHERRAEKVGSIKLGEIFGWLRNYWILKTDFAPNLFLFV